MHFSSFYIFHVRIQTKVFNSIGDDIMNKYEYIKVDNRILCRYPFNDELQVVSAIGDVYNFKTRKWKKTSSSMSYKKSKE